MFTYYEAIDEIDLEENGLKMMGPYNPAEPLARLINQLEKGRYFTREGGKMIAYVIMMLKGITPLVQTDTFNEDIWEWCQQYTELKTWEGFKTLFQRVHREQRRYVTTAVKGL